ncbi:FadR/GntR family transcriptional regulator [Cryptosporangium phraense]|uniref:Winged helix-turn-helix transcriptional regulator n=1 Tax=Cryptosporangium phraense TaxID=2593070 RepID=A0A545ANA2_9ACTN|nr:winged helix-turn-helix domain-containing protein [Cryptosporangium phraense]TQS42753.1 winged helix-turn-helix transcriptional regulator [Cryptosporangium phraense]
MTTQEQGTRNGQPTKYQYVIEQIRSRLTAGEWNPGERLPSETNLIEDFKVSRNTVRRAYQELQFAGLVSIRQGAGVFASPPRQPGERCPLCGQPEPTGGSTHRA